MPQLGHQIGSAGLYWMWGENTLWLVFREEGTWTLRALSRSLSRASFSVTLLMEDDVIAAAAVDAAPFDAE